MPGFNYARMQGTATRLLQRFAQGTITLTRVTPGAPDPATPWLPGEPTTTEYDLDATVSAITSDQASAKWIDGTTIVSSDMVVTCSVPAVGPRMSDYVEIDGVVQVIKKIVAIPAAGTPVVFKLVVGGGEAIEDVGPMLDFSVIANSQYVPLV